MAFTSYLTLNGKIQAQACSGVVTGYSTDAFGSLTSMVDNAGHINNRYIYRPYGSILVKSGISKNLRFLWLGKHGLRSSRISEFQYEYPSCIYSSSLGVISSPGRFHELFNYNNLSLMQEGSQVKGTIAIGIKGPAFPNTRFEVTPCKLLLWEIQWEITGNEGSSGWIVQEITRTLKWHDLDEACCIKEPLNLEEFHYWEAWRVEGNQVYTGKTRSNIYPEGIDNWAVADDYMKDKTFGYLYTAGKAKYFSNSEVKDDDPNNWPVVGLSPTTEKMPSWFSSGGVSDISRTHAAMWYCCGNDKKGLMGCKGPGVNYQQ